MSDCGHLWAGDGGVNRLACLLPAGHDGPHGAPWADEWWTDDSTVVDSPFAVSDAVARGKREINDDIAANIVPADVASFSDLHDYVDANEYGGLCDDTAFGAAGLKFANDVQTTLDAWIKAGRPDDAP